VSDFGSQAPPPPQQQAPPEWAGSATPGGGASGPRSGFWRRLGAVLIDSVILFVPYAVLLVLVDYTVAQLISVVIDWTYYTMLEGGRTGQTLGKRALGIRVIDFRAGGPIGYGRGLLRQIGKLLSGVVIALGYLWMLWDKENQTWHDKIATTVVVPASSYPVL